LVAAGLESDRGGEAPEPASDNDDPFHTR
jgi:hypothetical protein